VEARLNVHSPLVIELLEKPLGNPSFSFIEWGYEFL
jgi:hypothetical protein